MVSKKEVSVSWKEGLRDLKKEMIATIRAVLIVLGVLIIIIGLINYVPLLFNWVIS